MLSDVSSLLSGAAKDSEQAASQMDAAARNSEEKAELSPEQAEKTAKAQDAVREQLARLAEMLDRGEDTWSVGRNLQRLVQQQRGLMAHTPRAGEERSE